MPYGKPGPRGAYNAVTDPTRFTANANSKWIQHLQPEMDIFVYQSASGSDTISPPYSIGSTLGFSVTKLGVGDVEVQVSPRESTGMWYTVTTLSDNPTVYSNTDPHPLVKFVLKDGATDVSVKFWRKYSAY